MKLIIYILIVVLPLYGFAQSPGTGGVFIADIRDELGNKITSEEIKHFEIKAFLLNDTILATTNIYTNYPYRLEATSYRDTLIWKEVYDHNGEKTGRIKQESYKIPFMQNGLYLEPLKHFKSSYRLFMTNQEDTMIIDFVRVFGQNQFVGNKAKVHSLKFQSGYFQYKKKDLQGFHAILDTTWITTHIEEVNYRQLILTKERSISKYIKRAYRRQEKVRKKNDKIYRRNKNTANKT